MLSLTGTGKDLYQLSEINASPQAVVNRVNIRPEAVRGDLEMPLGRFIEFIGKGHGVPRRAPSKMPSENEFRVALKGHKTVGISPRRVIINVVLLLAADKSPEFIALHIGDRKCVDSGIQEPFALIPNKDKQRKNRCVVESGYALDCRYRASFNKKFNSPGSFLDRCVHAAERRCVTLREGLTALIAAEALKAVSVPSKLLAAGIAVVTGHRLAFLRKQADNGFGSAFAACSAIADLAPLSVDAEGGASYLRLGNPRYGFPSGADSFSDSLVGEPVPRSFARSELNDAPFFGEGLHNPVNPLNAVAGLFKSVFNFARGGCVILPIVFLPKHDEHGGYGLRVGLYRERDNPSIRSANLVKLDVGRCLRIIRQWGLLVCLNLGRLLWKRGNNLFEGIELALNHLGGPFGFKLMLSNLNLDACVVHC